MYSIKFTGEFKRDMRLCKKRGYDMELIREAIRILSVDGKLPKDYLPHQLHGDRKGQWECHIQPNWLLIWEQHDKELRMTDFLSKMKTTRPFRVFHGIFGWFSSFGR